MEGFVRKLRSEVEAYNQECLARLKAHAPETEANSYNDERIPDQDPDWCWFKVEEIFTSQVMTDEEREEIKQEQEAIALGMIIEEL